MSNKPGAADLVELLRIVAGMQPFLMADHSSEELQALDLASKLFVLPQDEVVPLATAFFAKNGVPSHHNWVSELATDEVHRNLIRHGYFHKCADGRVRITDAARKAIMSGDPYVITTIEEDKAFFAELAKDISAVFEDDNVVMPYLLRDVVDQFPRSLFAGRFKEGYGTLQDREQDMLLVLCSHFQVRGPIEWTLPTTLSKSERAAAVRTLGSLAERGLVTTLAPEGELDSKKKQDPPVVLSPGVAGYLFKGLGSLVNFGMAMTRYGSFLSADGIRERELFYNDDVAPDVERLHRAFSRERYDRMMEALASHGGRRSLTFLLYGPPGTGKTELALQLARGSGRSVLQADVAKLTGSYVGESERNYRGLFLVYRFAALVMDPAPVLLLNEADAFMSSRVQVKRSNDKYENNIQAVIIEEMESFEGLLVATTNNAANFDDAYDRRFLLKLEVGLPDAATRLRIWRSRLPELSADLAERLASRFRLTGAGIETVVSRFALIEPLEDRTPGYPDLMDLCALVERKAAGTKRNTMGFPTNG